MSLPLNTSLGRFRLIAILEGISYLVLLLIAMPLKYMAGIPEPVKYVGWAHGVLFVLFIGLLLQVWVQYRWSFLKVVLAFVSSLIPFGTFILDKKIAQDQPQAK
jgi:integral membrane protein